MKHKCKSVDGKLLTRGYKTPKIYKELFKKPSPESDYKTLSYLVCFCTKNTTDAVFTDFLSIHNLKIYPAMLSIY